MMGGEKPSYKIRIHIRVLKRVLKEFRSIKSARDRSRIAKRVAALADDPRPPGCEVLRGLDAYRIRQGDYRIVYAINDDTLTVLVVMPGNRKDVYRKLRRR